MHTYCRNYTLTNYNVLFQIATISILNANKNFKIDKTKNTFLKKLNVKYSKKERCKKKF
jgi:hypothetical protein